MSCLVISNIRIRTLTINKNDVLYYRTFNFENVWEVTFLTFEGEVSVAEKFFFDKNTQFSSSTKMPLGSTFYHVILFRSLNVGDV